MIVTTTKQLRHLFSATSILISNHIWKGYFCNRLFVIINPFCTHVFISLQDLEFFFPKASLSTFPYLNSIFKTKMWEFGLLIMSQWSQILWTRLLIIFSVLLLQCSHSSALSPSPHILLLPVLVFGADCIWFIEV